MRRSFDTEGAEFLFGVISCVSWCIGNMLCELVKLYCKKSNVTTIRYEDLKGNPKDTLDKLGKEIGIDLSEVIKNIEKNKSMSTGIGLSGNRMRRGKTEFIFRTGESEKNTIPMRYKLLCKVINFPLMVRYGYT